MINGNLEFEEIPLETLIGEFGKTINYDEIKTIERVKDEFIKYLSENTQSTSLDEYLFQHLLNTYIGWKVTLRAILFLNN